MLRYIAVVKNRLPSNPDKGFMSATTDVLHFGLGPVNVIDSIVVRWPDRSEQTIKDVR